MSSTKTNFEKDCNKLELTCLMQGYMWAVSDVEKILHDCVKASSTPEECILVLNIQTALHKMYDVRFPSPNTDN